MRQNRPQKNQTRPLPVYKRGVPDPLMCRSEPEPPWCKGSQWANRYRMTWKMLRAKCGCVNRPSIKARCAFPWTLQVIWLSLNQDEGNPLEVIVLPPEPPLKPRPRTVAVDAPATAPATSSIIYVWSNNHHNGCTWNQRCPPLKMYYNQFTG